MTNNYSFFAKAMPLFLILFIDAMGLGLVLPILNGLIFDPSSKFLAGQPLSPLMHNVVYGAVIGIFMFCWFFGAALLGDLSDQIGRKKSLVVCLIGAFLSYLLSALAVEFYSLSLILIGRMVAGFTAGSQPIAQAAIIDLSKSEDKARNIGFIMLSLSLGFVFGPLFGGILADKNIVSWFNFATPFYFAAIISFLNIIILLVLFKETFVSKSTTYKVSPYQAINIFLSAFKHKSVRNLSILFFIFVFGWSSFYSFISLYLLKTYQFSPTKISLYMAVMGIGFGLGTGFVVNFIAKFFTLRDSYIYCALASSICTLLMVAIPSELFNWLLIMPMSCFIATAFSCILTLFSNQVDEKSQGWVMGITGSVSAFVWGINGIIVGLLAAWDDRLPLFIAGIFLLFAALATYFIFKPESK